MEGSKDESKDVVREKVREFVDTGNLRCFLRGRNVRRMQMKMKRS